MDALDALDARLERMARTKFRGRIQLRGRDRAIVDLRGIETIREHARKFIGERLAPAEPRNDGKQTPYRGHPVFVAQHATATCCRGCLERWHGISAGHALDEREQTYVIEVICRWIIRQYGPTGPPP